MINTRPFIFAEGNKDIKIREVLMAEEVDRPLEERSRSKWFRGRKFLPMSVDVSEISNMLWCNWLYSVYR